jgi:hypothetical protein
VCIKQQFDSTIPETRYLAQEVIKIPKIESEQPKHIRSILPGKRELRDRRGLGETMNGDLPQM